VWNVGPLKYRHRVGDDAAHGFASWRKVSAADGPWR
jgi:hypothetical protein